MTRTDEIKAAAVRFNIPRDDLEYLLTNDNSPGVLEWLEAEDDYDYFGSLAEHECQLARLAEVSDRSSFIDACLGLRSCGYAEPTVIKGVKEAARVVGDPVLLGDIAMIQDQEELLETILHGYGCGNTCIAIKQMDGSALLRIPLGSLGVAA